ncbi:MAG: hypothetical protein ACLFT2_06565 [Candidatus Brocadiia bacterium]
MRPEDIFDQHLNGTIYRDKQVDSNGVHLTVDTIMEITGRGQIDFGGGEYEPAETCIIEPEKRSAGDDYGWWELPAGLYRVKFNESVLADNAGNFILLPNSRLIGCNCSLAPCCPGEGTITTTLTVPETGLSIKENARIALLVAT